MQQLTANARQPRQSSNTRVREHVYANPNLTRAEAEAAYHARQQRRQLAQDRANRQRQRSDEQATEHTDPVQWRLLTVKGGLNNSIVRYEASSMPHIQ